MNYIISAAFGLIGSLYSAYSIHLYSQLRDSLDTEILPVMMAGAFIFPVYFVGVSMLKPGRIPFVRKIAAVIHILVILSFVMGALSSIGIGIEANPVKDPLPLMIGILAPLASALATYTNLRWARQNLLESAPV